ncbi:leucine-rich PPR motif-containing protein, mitochondrial-like isoform X8 [Daktulosphaira vitifoliae]|uniref:leucine-rich PPR motif-containing protein, mitochondrial-like isoform X8 n=1 Tax=Daktulosphaira vitifoliae TaxID=58002 RepID=UPI0021A9B370|nr:leucine-rich PPR motif-containing protein, mitochondrial-like isoform X8 [Daktulosphaira vitifoliae]
MSILMQCSKQIRTAFVLSRHRISNTLITSSNNSNGSQKPQNEKFTGITTHYNNNLLPSRSFFSSTIHHSTSVKNVDKQIKKLDEDVRKFGRISKRELESILKEIEENKSATSSQSLLIIRCCGTLLPDELPENRTKLVQKIWTTLNNLDVPMDISHYNTLLKVYLENDYQFSPTDFIEDLNSKGIVPNRVTYQHLVTAFCKKGDIEGASRILEYMRDKQLPINQVVFNALVLGHSQNGDMDSAQDVLNIMKESKLEPSSETYSLLASGFAKKGDIEKVHEILSSCKNHDVYLTHNDYFDIVHSLAVNGHRDKIDEILNQMHKTTGYNQDAINCIYKLITAGEIECAIKVFESMKKPTNIEGSPSIGRFFIAHLTKINCPVNKIINFCQKLVDEGSNPRAFEYATEMALKNGSVNIALGLFEYMKQKEQSLRQHYFWPLLVSKNKQNDLNGLNDLLSIMINSYNLSPNIDTLRHYVLPLLFKNNLSGVQIISNLQLVGIPSGTSTHALVLYLLSNNEIRQAADIAATHRAFYLPNIIRQPLVNAFLSGNDIKSLVVILQQICNGFSRLSLVTSPESAKYSNDKFVPSSDTEEQIIEMKEFIGQVVSNIVNKLQKSSGATQITQELLEALYEKGLGLSSRSAEQIQQHLQSKLTFEISNLLENLTDSSLTRKVELDVKPGGYTLANVDEKTLENIIKKGESSGETKNGAKRQLFNLYCKNKNLEKAIALKEKLDAEGFNIPTGSLVFLIDLYLSNNKLEEAKYLYQQLTSADPNFVLDKYKMVKMADLIVKDESVEKAIEFLSSIKQSDENKDTFVSFQHSNNCWKLLNNIADKGKADDVQKVFDLLILKNYNTVSNILLGPLIKVHIINNDIKGALDKFEWCCKTYRCTPWKNELALKFIEAEDATSLQILTDLSTTVHGEINSLYDLMLAFVESGRIKQARKILETPGLRARQDRLNLACSKYGTAGSEEFLLRLIEVTKDVNQFDRLVIFNELMELYSKKNKVDEAVGLWTQIQEENIQPSNTFMWSLSELLKKNNREVPFVVEKPTEESPNIPSNNNKSLNVAFETNLNNNNVLKAFEVRNQIYSKGYTVHPSKESILIELLTREDKLSEAMRVTKEMLLNNKPISKNVLRFLIKRLSEAGEVDSLIFLNDKLSKALCNQLTLNKHICNAHLTNGKIMEMLNSINKSINENINDEKKLMELTRALPGGTIINILKKEPATLSLIENIEAILKSKGNTVFTNSLWSYFMLNGAYNKAEKLISSLENCERIQYRHILADIRSNNNVELGTKMLEMIPKLKALPNKNSNKGLIYSALIDGYINKENYIEANNTLDMALKELKLEDINESALLRLKEKLESMGQTFKHDNSKLKKKVVKNRELKSDSDSESSDDDKTSKFN